MAEVKEKTGVETGARAMNPCTQREIPIWVADYVLATYGTGAIMAVPGHDERDFEFATAFGLPIVRVVDAAPGKPSPALPFMDDGVGVNSGFLDGLPTPQAKRRMIEWLTKGSPRRGHDQLQAARLAV